MWSKLSAQQAQEAAQAASRLALSKPTPPGDVKMTATLRWPDKLEETVILRERAHSVALDEFGPEAEAEAKGFPVHRLTAPEINVVSTVVEDMGTRFRIVLAHSAALPSDVDRVEALVYSPWEKKESRNAVWAYVAKAEGWEHDPIIKSGLKRHVLRARWDSPQKEYKKGDVTVRGLLAHLPFLCNGPVQYQVNEVTSRIYWVHVIDLSGWQAVLQVNGCAPAPAFAEQMQSTGAPETGGKLGSMPLKALHRYAVGTEKAYSALSAIEQAALDPIFGELQRELIALHDKAERARVDTMGAKVRWQLLNGKEDVDAAEVVELLVVMLSGLRNKMIEEHGAALAASGETESAYKARMKEELRAQRKPSMDEVRKHTATILQSCMDTPPSSWWMRMVPEPFSSKELLLKNAGELCCLPFIPPTRSLREILHEARESDYVMQLYERPIDDSDVERKALQVLLDKCK